MKETTQQLYPNVLNRHKKENPNGPMNNLKRYSASLVIGKCELNPNKTPLHIQQIGKIKISENNKYRQGYKQREHKYTAGGSIIATINLSLALLST